MFSRVKKCRVCSSASMYKYISLGALPLANNLVPKDKDSSDDHFPLEVQLCTDCKLSQLTVVVQPEILFSEYAYRTSISVTFQKHFEQLAKDVMKIFPETKKCLVLDIGSNDGCLLDQFRKQGFNVLGIEPAQNLAKIANENGIKTIPEFWGVKASKVVLEKHGMPDVITATNVFAHVDDVHSFLRNVKNTLSGNGIFIVEVPYALHLLQNNEFDTIYHEHLSYFLIAPMLLLFEIAGMEVFDVQNIPTHGGSIRVFAKKPENQGIKVKFENIKQFLDSEERMGLYEIAAYERFAQRTLDVKIAFLQLISKLKKEGKKIAGYGASAKASTLLNYCNLGEESIEFIIDDAPEKQGKAFAGNRIPVAPNSLLEEKKPGILAVFAWTIAKEIIQKTPSHQSRGGKYLIPLPVPRILANEKEL